MATSIFGCLQKRARLEEAEEDEATTAEGPGMSFEDREDLLNDLLEEDDTKFPLLSCPSEVLHAILVSLPVSITLRMRATCCAERGAIDGHVGLWSALIVRDFQDLGGVTKHYKGFRMAADACKNSKAIVRLEWDPLMICGAPSLRYALLLASQERRDRWNDFGYALGAGWAWFSTKVCRRMAASTFKRWAACQYSEESLRSLLVTQPEGCQLPAPAASSSSGAAAVAQGDSQSSQSCRAGGEEQAATDCSAVGPSVRFRSGRSDAVVLSHEAATDIYETVQRWHGKAHRDAMREFLKGDKDDEAANDSSAGKTKAAPAGAASGTLCAPIGFSFTPTLDMAEAAAIAAAERASAAEAEAGEAGGTAATPAAAARGDASRRLEEAQLRMALELSKEEAEAASAAAAQRTAGDKKAAEEETKAERKAGGEDEQAPEPKKLEATGLVLKTEGAMPDVLVFLKEHCLAPRVDDLPENFGRSIKHIVDKMMKSSWALLYESVSEELGFRAKCAAHALFSSHAQAVDYLLSGEFSLEQERMCLPIWRSSGDGMMSGLSQLRSANCAKELREARCALVRQATLEWCELEDFTAFLDEQLGQLELAIDSERAIDMRGNAHTPHIRDLGRLMFRNSCLLDSRVFRPLCLAAYALVHEIDAATNADKADNMIDLLDGLHHMVATCDVADDHKSESKETKEVFGENLVKPLTAALERYRPYDIRGGVDCGEGVGMLEGMAMGAGRAMRNRGRVSRQRMTKCA
eukprot:TRINITY_DN28389_c0_g1_i1.p1 TRINITY_DN28389_c0_g1~~TRINITY_DN28389_c0_g1_i1.p1  ORF type:complete len:751 (+),score=200.25 TRINITY_DN28389_c0_g1_i1:89-2341(+)